MKFFSVFVLCIYVRTAYSYYVGSPYKPIPQNTGTPNFAENVYPNPQENVSNQPTLNQQTYNMGPGVPIPYQIADSPPGTQNNVQLPQPYNGAYSPPPAERIASSLKEIYTKSVPTKRYTIVHPNGTIEHTDELHTVTSRYSNYHMVKAADILAKINQHNQYNGMPQNTLPSQSNGPITTTNQNSNWSSYNSYKQSQQNDSPVIPNNPNAVSSNPAAEPSIKQNTQEVDEVATAQGAPSNAVAANPLPVYPTEPTPINTEQNKQTSASPAAKESVSDNLTETQGVGDPVAVSDSNSDDSSTPTRPTITVQLPAEIDEQEALQVIIPELLKHSTVQETQTPTTNEGPEQSQVTPEITTIEEPIPQDISTPPNNTSSSELANVVAPNAILDVSQPKDDTVDNAKPIGETESPTNTATTTNTVQKPNDDSEDNSLIPSACKQTSTTNSNETPLTSFFLSEDRLWEAIQSNASNVYFFFLPPKPKTYKEIRTTIYPNGTKVEEIIERDVDENQDGQPDVTKNATVLS